MLDSWQKGKHRMRSRGRSVSELVKTGLGIFTLILGGIAAHELVAQDSSVNANIVPRPKPNEPAVPQPKANIRIDTNVVLIPVTVTDPLNRFVTGLDQDV